MLDVELVPCEERGAVGETARDAEDRAAERAGLKVWDALIITVIMRARPTAWCLGLGSARRCDKDRGAAMRICFIK
jgi:hypothetical protein